MSERTGAASVSEQGTSTSTSMSMLGGRVARLSPVRGPGARKGVFDVVLETPGGKWSGLAEPARLDAPVAFRAPLAFYRLARELGMGVVPLTGVRAVAIADLGAALEGGAAKQVLRELRVQNDGTVDVLLAAKVEGTTFDLGEERAVAAWDRWAGEGAPAAGEDGGLLRDYVEMLVLDYLSANVGRRAAVRASGGIRLVENGSAFPAHTDPGALDRMIRKLRGVARFPRGLREALGRFDRARAAATFQEGRFEEWLLSPRALVELDERRAALLTLVEARVAERGAEAVLSL